MITPLNGCKAVELSKIAIDMDSTMLSFLGSAINLDTGLSIIHRHQLKKFGIWVWLPLLDIMSSEVVVMLS